MQCLGPLQGGWRQRGAMEAAGTGRALVQTAGRGMRPRRYPSGAEPPGRMERGLRAGQAFRMDPQAAPASDAKSPAGIGSDAGGAP